MEEAKNEPAKSGMSELTRRGLEILQAALVLGILGDSLFRGTPWGLNIFLWVTMLTVAMWLIVTRHRTDGLSTGSIALHSALIFFGAMFVWRDSIQLAIADVFAMLMILAVLSLPALKLKLESSGLVHYLLGWVYCGFNTAFSMFFLVFGDINWKSIPHRKGTGTFTAALRGLLIAVPILLIFGGLFVAADATYQKLVEQTFHINIEKLIGHAFLIAFLSWIAAGYLRGATHFSFDNFSEPRPESTTILASDLNLKDQPVPPPPSAKKIFDLQDLNNTLLPKYFTLGAVEVGVILGLMNLLFLSFVIVQVPYLFGGMELVQKTEDLKLAEYARRGFEELVLVSALVLPTLLIGNWLISKEDTGGLRLFQILSGVQLVLLFVIMISASQRMLLYTGTSGYGLTTTRFYPMVFMVWLIGVFVWFGITVLRGQRSKFAWGTLWSALAGLALLHVINPDYVIARTNIELMHAGRTFDAHYVSELSDDAVPVLLEKLGTMSNDQRCQVQFDLNQRMLKDVSTIDLRTWNFSRWSAGNELRAAVQNFDQSGCMQARPLDSFNDGF